MAVVKHQPHCVITDGFDCCDCDVFLACLESPLVGTVALDFGARRVHSQVLEAVIKTVPIVEGDDQQARCFAKFNFSWDHIEPPRLQYVARQVLVLRKFCQVCVDIVRVDDYFHTAFVGCLE